MESKDKAGAGSEKTVRCPRINELRSVEEHKECPYCFGKLVDVALGDRQDFCDYKPNEDPVNFGFPGGSSRNTEG